LARAAGIKTKQTDSSHHFIVRIPLFHVCPEPVLAIRWFSHHQNDHMETKHNAVLCRRDYVLAPGGNPLVASAPWCETLPPSFVTPFSEW
jgi:hypothetical protein